MPTINPEKNPVEHGVLDVLASMEMERTELSLLLDEAAVRKEFNIEEDKAAAVKVRLDVGAIKGTQPPAEIVQEAVEMLYSKRYTYDNLPTGLRTRMMDLYLNRVRWLYLPVAGLISLAAAIGITQATVNSIRYRALEANLTRQEMTVESTVDKLSQTKAALQGQMREISSYVAEKKPIDAADLSQILAMAESQLSETDAFFARYMPSQAEVTRENFNDVSREASTIDTILGNVAQQIGKGKELVALDEGLINVRQSLDSLIAEVRSADPVDILLQKAETAYQSGVSSADHRQLKQAQEYRQQLSQIKIDAHEFAALPQNLDNTYAALLQIVKHKPTKEWADNVYAEAKSYVANADVAPLKQSIEQLNNMAATLKQDYQLFIYVEQGKRTCWDVEFDETDSRGNVTSTSNTGYFLRMRAKDTNTGKFIPITFYDVAYQRTVTDEDFGVLICHSENDPVFEKVRQLVRSGTFGREPYAAKRRGYPDIDGLFRSTNGSIVPVKEMTSMTARD